MVKFKIFIVMLFLGMIASSVVCAQQAKEEKRKSDFFIRQMTPQNYVPRYLPSTKNYPQGNVNTIKSISRPVKQRDLPRKKTKKQPVPQNGQSLNVEQEKVEEKKKDMPYLTYKEEHGVGKPPEEIENLLYMKAIIEKRLQDPKYKAYKEKIEKDKKFKDEVDAYTEDIETGRTRSGRGKRFNKKIDKDINAILNKLD
jgi:hypothetical protein